MGIIACQNGAVSDPKVEDALNLALDMDATAREKTADLDVGYDSASRSWELIVKYSGDLQALADENISIVYLMNNYAIITVPQNRIDFVAAQPQVEYIEKPKRLFFAADAAARSASCINTVQSGPAGLTGRGVIVALIDSGIDFTHPDFRRADNTTRILALWDQTVTAPYTVTLEDGGQIELEPPKGYRRGVLFTEEVINAALRSGRPSGQNDIVRSVDYSGHGTAVMGIAAGNGRQGGQAFRGVAYESDLLVVKLGTPDAEGFPRTTELMQAINFVLEEGIRRGQPIVVNISFGNNYGSHDGTSLLETYINDVSGAGRSLIVIGTGNEAAASGHTSGSLFDGQPGIVELAVGEFQPALSVQVWKNFVDVIDLEIIAPSGRSTGAIQERLGPVTIDLENTRLLVYYGEASPYSMSQEIFIEMIPTGSGYVDFGLWNIRLIPVKIVDGDYRMWLPGGAARNQGTRFLEGNPYLTLTIPSTAAAALSVGAYDASTGAVADFSGRGNDSGCTPIGGCMLKPDLVAPGVNIRTTMVGGGYTTVTGTSFATPFVTGSAALLMEWGIIQGNSPYLYGEKVKAYLLSGAAALTGIENYPNALSGYGKLCLSRSLDRLL